MSLQSAAALAVSLARAVQSRAVSSLSTSDRHPFGVSAARSPCEWTLSPTPRFSRFRACCTIPRPTICCCNNMQRLWRGLVTRQRET
ncbi:hypothetical protein B0H65DRAFT_238553 [Neurospora tetraspora]|uniref:Uncharacterized protein n=1 Tax=Neurospora tetraspora TaxID=94610 RepID=A0AAE0MS54_9PEZI|nr:hypothetical protein B0H65DRAFT_238553 [Neurospora tetraspora]